MPLSFKDRQDAKVHFDSMDHDRNGHITLPELTVVMKSLGENPTESEVKKIISEVDANNDGTVDFEEFCVFLERFRAGKASGGGFGDVYVKNANVNVVTSKHATHTFSDDEKESFVEHINSCLGNDADLKHLVPINTKNLALFEAVKDGILICKLINYSVPKTIDERAINKGRMNPFQMTENQNLCINSAKAIGCSVVNMGPTDLMEGKVHLVLGLIWQIIRIGLLASINLKNHPYLIRLLEPGETLEDLLKLSPEQILLRWFNYHLKQAGHHRRVNNFGGDIKDSENYSVLLSQIAPKQCGSAKTAMQTSDLNKRAEIILDAAAKIDCKKFVRPRDIVAANTKLNLAFVANLFNTCPGLEPVEEPVIVEEETREEKAFKAWINSLGVDPYVNRLYEDLRDGIILLQVLDAIKPGIVDWKRVNTVKPLNKFKQVENCNYALELGKSVKFSLVGIGGQDIQTGNPKLTLALVWQAMRMYILNYLNNISKGGKQITEEDIIHWANSKVRSGRSFREFKDKSLSDSLFILDLLTALQPESVQQSVITGGSTPEDKLLNAQYAISVARKMGCTVFLLPEDIVEVQPKLMMTFFGAVMSVFGK